MHKTLLGGSYLLTEMDNYFAQSGADAEVAVTF